ncbi:gas vesicle protein GvpJ [Streptomyces alkaliphilus]|uniref:gas vesicle protein GvpJ n=1 Tax=Streptomyces alkaliphilus TaxID=1472722 RepID=UPI00117D6317|nr:gas vesicle protein GvpJ [Streptomyces alkaliphilus]MQS06827.1 gas vesicle protein [Streptomyces alkaliphilus]
MRTGDGLMGPEEEAWAPIGVPLVDLLDRVLATGVVIGGDVVVAIAEVPLVRLSLHALLSSVGGRVASPFGDVPGCGEEPWRR